MSNNRFLLGLGTITAAVVAIDLTLVEYMQNVLEYTYPAFMLIDAGLVLVAGLLGLATAKQLSFPVWINTDSSRREKRISLILGFGIIICNILVYRFYPISTHWLTFSNLKEPVLVSLRAALSEELYFRFFIFSIATFLARKVSNSASKSVFTGIVVSSILFGLYHPGFVLAFIYAVVLCYVYLIKGLIPAMGVHFLANAIPFVLIFLQNN